MPPLRWSCVLALAPFLAACEGSSPGETAPAKLTYYENVKRVIDAKCTSCHRSGGIAPFSLTSYDEVSTVQGLVRNAVAERVMPPSLASPGCNEYAADRALDDEQIAAITQWIDEGAAEGDKAHEGPPLDTGPSYALSRVDRTLTPAEAFTASPEADDYRCVVLDWPETEETFVTGFRANPDDARSVHHVIAFVAPPDQVAALTALDQSEPGPGYTCYGGPGVGAGWLGVFIPGSDGADFPPGTGIRIDPGSKIILQIHYTPLNGSPKADRTSVDFKLDSSVDKEAWIQPWFDPSWYGAGVMMLPAGDPEVSYSVAYDPTLFVTQGKALVMYTVGLHMHALGTRGSVTLQKAGGEEECLLDIQRWNPHWQGSYGFAEPKLIGPGDRIHQECHWDNSAANQLFAGGKKQPPKDVDWGEAATDEMCLGAFYVTLQ